MRKITHNWQCVLITHCGLNLQNVCKITQESLLCGKIPLTQNFLHSRRDRCDWQLSGMQKRSPVGPRYPDGDPFGNNASLESLFWVSICSSAACFPGSGRKEEPGKMEEPGLNFCRERFAIVLWTFCDFFPTFLPLMPLMHLMVACQCQNKSPAHFLLQIIAIF